MQSSCFSFYKNIFKSPDNFGSRFDILSLKYQWFTFLDCKEIAIRKFGFFGKNSFTLLVPFLQDTRSKKANTWKTEMIVRNCDMKRTINIDKDRLRIRRHFSSWKITDKENRIYIKYSILFVYRDVLKIFLLYRLTRSVVNIGCSYVIEYLWCTWVL